MARDNKALSQIREKQQDKQRQAIKTVLQAHADKIVAGELGSFYENFKSVGTGYQNAQSGYTTAEQFDKLDSQRQSLVSQGDTLLKWLPFSTLNEDGKNAASAQVKQILGYADSGYAQKFSGSENRLKQRNSLDLLGSDLRDVYGQYKDAQDYETFSKLQAGSIDDVKAYIDEMKAAGTEKIVKETQRILGAATADIEIDTGKYLYQDQIDRAQVLLASKIGEKYGVADSAYADVMRKADSDFLTGNLSKEDYDLLDAYAGYDASEEDYGARLDYLNEDAAVQRSDELNEIYNEWAQISENLEKGNYTGKEIEWAEGRLQLLSDKLDELGFDEVRKREEYYTSAAEALDDSAIPQSWRKRVNALDEQAVEALDTYNQDRDMDNLRRALGRTLADKDDNYVKELAQWRKNILSLDEARAQAQAIQERDEDLSDWGKWWKTLGNIWDGLAGTPSALVEGIRGAFEGAEKGDAYKAYAYNAGFNRMRNSQVSANVIAQDIGDKYGQSAQTVYSAVSSAIENALVTGITAGTGATIGATAGAMSGTGALSGAVSGAKTVGKLLTPVIMSSRAAASELYTRISEGQSNDKALTYAVATFAVETLSESISIGEIMDMVMSRETGSLAKIMLLSAKNEGLEEIASNWGMRLFDTAMEGRESELYQSILKRQENGQSTSQALAGALGDVVSEDAESFITGALSGMLMSGTAAGVKKTSETVLNAGKKVLQNRADTKAVIQNGTQEDLARAVVKNLSGSQNKSDSAMVSRAQEYLDSIDNADNAKDLTNKEIRQMTGAVNNALRQQLSKSQASAIQSGISEWLQERDVQEPETVAAVAYKALTGQSLNEDEKSLIRTENASEAVQQVLHHAKELNGLSGFITEQIAEDIFDTEEKVAQVHQSYTATSSLAENRSHPIVTLEAKGKGEKQPVPVKIDRIESIEAQGFIVLDTRGKKQNIRTAQIANREARAFYEAAIAMGTADKANAFIRAASPETGLHVDQMPEVFEAFYAMGQTGVAMENKIFAGSGLAGRVSGRFKREAFRAGQASSKSGAEHENAGIRFVGDANREAFIKANKGTFRKSGEKYAGAILDLMETIADHTGVEIVIGRLNKGINGFSIPNTNRIVLNMNVEYGLFTRTLGHELFHVLKSNTRTADMAADLQNQVISWLKERGTYETVRKDMQRRYAHMMQDMTKEIADAYLNEEVAADSCFDALSNDAFLADLVSTSGNKELLQRIIDFIDDIRRMISEALRSFIYANENDPLIHELSADKRMLDNINAKMAQMMKVLHEEKNNNLNQNSNIKSEIKLQIKYDRDNVPYVVIDRDILHGVAQSEWTKTVKNNLRKKFPSGVSVGNNTIVINKQSQRELTFSKYMKWALRHDTSAYADKLRATDNADEIVKAARKWVNEALLHPRNDAIIEFARGVIQMRVGANDYTAQVIVGKQSDEKLLLYDIIKLQPTTIRASIKKTDTPKPAIAQTDLAGEGGASVTDNTISQSDTSVNSNYMQESTNDTIKFQMANNVGDGADAIDLIKENKELKQQNERLRGELQLSKSAVADMKSARAFVRRLESLYGINYDTAAFNKAVDDVRKIYKYLNNPSVYGEMKADTAQEMAYLLASDMVERSGYIEKSEYSDQEKAFRSMLRKTGITLNDAQKTEAASAYDGYTSFLRRAFGQMTVRNEGGLVLEDVWAEACDIYGLDSHIADGDMPVALLDAMKASSQAAKGVFRSHMLGADAVLDLTTDIINGVMDGGVKMEKTFADRQKERVQKRDQKIKDLKADYQQRLRGMRERYSNEKVIKRIVKQARSLAAELEQNDKKKHIADALKGPVADLLEWIAPGVSAYSESDRLHHNRISDLLYRVRKGLKVKDENSSEIVLPEGFIDRIESLADELREQVDNYLSSAAGENETGTVSLAYLNREQLDEMEAILKVVHQSIANVDEFLANERYKNIDDARQSTKSVLAAARKRKGSQIGEFFGFDNLMPVYFFEQFGRGGQEIFKELTKGNATMAMLVKEAADYREKLLGSDLRAPDRWAKEELKVTLGGQKVTITTAQAMTLYMLDKRPQAWDHIYEGGIKLRDEKGKEKSLIKPTKSEVKAISQNALTAEQRKVADGLQRFLAQRCAAWGNEVTMRLWGISAYTEDAYFPIDTDKVNTQGADSLEEIQKKRQELDSFAVANRSFTKKTKQGAENPLVISDIFDIYSKHTYEMAAYNGLTLPMYDLRKWWKAFDYKEVEGHKKKINDSSVEAIVKDVFGEEALRYYNNLVADINGSSGQVSYTRSRLQKLVGHSRAANVSASFKVSVMQFLSYIRAGYVINSKYLIRAVPMSRKNSDMLEKSGIAVWKGMGMYDAAASKNVRDVISGKSTRTERIRSLAMSAAEWADEVTWKTIWNAVKLEAQDKGLKQGTKAFDDYVTDRFEEVIYKTQVVDSALTRSGLMRSKSDFVKMNSAYMSEPTLSYNVFADASRKLAGEIKQGKVQKKTLNNFFRMLAVTFISFGSESLMDALFYALRDEKDKDFDKKFKEQFKQALLNNMPLVSEVPYLSQLWDVLSGWISGGSINTYNMSGINDLSAVYDFLNVTDAVLSFAKGEGTAYSTIYSGLTAVSAFTGIGFGNAARDFVMIWNNIASAAGLDDYKIRKRAETVTSRVEEIDGKSMSQNEAIEHIRSLYAEYEQSGDKTSVKSSVSEFYHKKYDESKSESEKAEMLDTMYKTGLWSKTQLTEKEDNWIYKQTHTDKNDTFAKTDELYQAFASGQGIPQAIDRYKRYTAKTGEEAEKFAKEQATEQCKEAYIAGEFDDERAIQYIRQYLPVKSPKETLKEWQQAKAKKQTQNAFMDGDIDEKQAVSALMASGFKRKQADEAVEDWKVQVSDFYQFTKN